MVEHMKKVVEFGEKLTPLERNYLSSAYKNCVGVRRNALRTLKIYIQELDTTTEVNMAKEYIERIEDEIKSLCQQLFVGFKWIRQMEWRGSRTSWLINFSMGIHHFYKLKIKLKSVEF